MYNHYNKHQGVGAIVWQAILGSTKEINRTRDFNYTMDGVTLNCLNFDKDTFAIAEIKIRKHYETDNR